MAANFGRGDPGGLDSACRMTPSAPSRLVQRLDRAALPPLGFGAFKIGRNQGIKYPTAYELPDDLAVERLLNGVLDMGLCHIDTAPAYGFSEAQIGRCLRHRRQEFILSTKVGETFLDGRSQYDFSTTAIRDSLKSSFEKLQTDVLDLVLIHAPADDVAVLTQTDVVEELLRWRAAGQIRAIGLSGKTTAAATLALEWADVLMVEFHQEDVSHREVIQAAARAGIGVLVKKGLASGKLPAAEAIRFVLQEPGVTNLIVGSLNLEHLRENWQVALSCR